MELLQEEEEEYPTHSYPLNRPSTTATDIHLFADSPNIKDMSAIIIRSFSGSFSDAKN